MQQSIIIDHNGVFLGVAVVQSGTYRFVATHLRVEDLDASHWPTLPRLRQAVTRLFVTGSLASAPIMASIATPPALATA